MENSIRIQIFVIEVHEDSYCLLPIVFSIEVAATHNALAFCTFSMAACIGKRSFRLGLVICANGTQVLGTVDWVAAVIRYVKKSKAFSRRSFLISEKSEHILAYTHRYRI